MKLLRVLEEKRFELVGSERTVEVDVRVVSATNRNLRQMVADGDFREDLYYRLAVVPIFLPPLRERRADIPLVAERVLEDVRQETGKDIERIADQAMTCFLSYRWPGNVRELINALQFAAVRCTGRVIEISHLPPEVVCGEEGAEPLPAQAAGRKPGRKAKLNEVAVRNALLAAGGNKVKAAKILGVGRATLYRFLNEHPVSI